MKFKIDENLPAETSVLLRSFGHDAMTVYDQHLVGEPDDRILEVCTLEERVLITLDLDFADIRTYPPQDNFGLIVLRLHRQDKHYVLSMIQKIVSLFDQEEIKHRLWIVDEDKVRIRGEETGRQEIPNS